MWLWMILCPGRVTSKEFETDDFARGYGNMDRPKHNIIFVLLF